MISWTVALSKKFESVPYSSEKAQKILEKEFSDPGFTFYLVEEEKIFFGDKAAERTAEKFWRSKILGKFFLKTYPALSKLFSVLSRRKGVKQPECSDGRCLVNRKDGGVIERA